MTPVECDSERAMSHPNTQLLETFYAAFARYDAGAMGACYADDVRFSDPVFPHLEGDAARGMWRMLCARGADVKLRIEPSGISADETSGRAHWDAFYVFSVTGRPVHNKIDASFTFRGGRIVQHTDAFDLWAWCGMALGPTGRLFGWFPPLQNTVRKRADGDLRKFLAKGR